MIQKLKRFVGFFLPIRKSIVFESNPEFSCNTLPVYHEMMRRGIAQDYQIYWLVEDKTKYQNDTSGVKYLNYSEKGFAIFKKIFILATSKALIFSNRFLTKYKKEQLVVNLTHGSPLKMVLGYYENDTCDYVITQSAYSNDAMSKMLNVPREKMIPLGYPRTDILGKRCDARGKLGLKSKYLMTWMPTFRKNKNSGIAYGDLNHLGVPLLHSAADFERINDALRNSDTILVIKLHPAEDTSAMQLNRYSNILFLSDGDLADKNTTAYELLSDSDALLTDYSSVYYDYLLLDRPIGLVIDDLEDYDKNIGFAYGEYKSFVKGDYIQTIDAFLSFIHDLSNGIDRQRNDRHWAIAQYCQYRDFDSTNRVVDFIFSKLS